MNFIPTLIITALILLLGVLFLTFRTPHSVFQLPSRRRATFANIGEGVYEHGLKPYLADAVGASRYLFYKIGSDGAHVTFTAGLTDIPLGTSDDVADADLVEPITIRLLGAAKGTQLCITDGSFANGDFICATANGQATKLPTTTGTYYIVGRAQIDTDTSANAGDTVPFIPCFPTQRVVA